MNMNTEQWINTMYELMNWMQAAGARRKAVHSGGRQKEDEKPYTKTIRQPQIHTRTHSFAVYGGVRVGAWVMSVCGVLCVRVN